MSVIQKLMRAGSFDLQLDTATPKLVRDLIDFFGHIYLFDGVVRSGQSDATMINASRWGGVVRRRATPFAVGGTNMIAWLGDEDGKGPIIEAPLTGTAQNFAQWIALILGTQTAIVSGGTGAVAGTFTNTYQWVTPRQALDHLSSIFGTEYYIDKAGKLWAGVTSYLFKTPAGGVAGTPTVVAMKRSSGREPGLATAVNGVPVTRLDVSIDSEEHFTRALIKDATGAWTGANGSATPYKDLTGAALKMTKAVQSTLTPNANAAALATSTVTAGQVLRNQIVLSSDLFDITRDTAGGGDYIWVYDPDGNMVDMTQAVRYRGGIIYPIALRVMGVTWPIERGLDVWYRSRDAVWTNLTPYVLFEPAGSTLEVGAKSRALLTTP